MTTRGFGTDEARRVAGWIADVLDDLKDENARIRVKKEVEALCARFPVYGQVPGTDVQAAE